MGEGDCAIAELRTQAKNHRDAVPGLGQLSPAAGLRGGRLQPLL